MHVVSRHRCCGYAIFSEILASPIRREFVDPAAQLHVDVFPSQVTAVMTHALLLSSLTFDVTSFILLAGS